tara:strand:- start:146 stop:532 length:387 start_codon:yes stop_codon:yes gene_type:complete
MNFPRERIEVLRGSPAINDEFARKVKELDRRLQMNGMKYVNWDSLNDRQQDIFSHDLFLDGSCASNVNEYVMGAVDSCWCPDVVEDLHHHSPALMKAIEEEERRYGPKEQYSESMDGIIDNVLQSILN